MVESQDEKSYFKPILCSATLMSACYIPLRFSGGRQCSHLWIWILEPNPLTWPTWGTAKRQPSSSQNFQDPRSEASDLNPLCKYETSWRAPDKWSKSADPPLPRWSGKYQQTRQVENFGDQSQSFLGLPSSEGRGWRPEQKRIERWGVSQAVKHQIWRWTWRTTSKLLCWTIC